MAKLNPCPGCGREPDFEEDVNFFRVACWRCSSTEYVTSRTANGAINAWNAATHGRQVTQDKKTLRDKFAMAALQGVMANPSGPIQANGMSGWGWCNCSASDVANFIYLVADAMLKERENEAKGKKAAP